MWRLPQNQGWFSAHMKIIKVCYLMINKRAFLPLEFIGVYVALYVNTHTVFIYNINLHKMINSIFEVIWINA